MDRNTKIKSAIQNNFCPAVSINPWDMNRDIQLIKDSDNLNFCVFKSINNIHYLIYKNNLNYIISYDLTNFQKLSQIKFTDFDCDKIKHFLDKINKRDLILFINFEIIKIFNAVNWTCLGQIKEKIPKNLPIEIEFRLIAYNCNNACMFENNKKNYIVTSKTNSQYFKFWEINGHKIKEIKTPNKKNLIIKTYNNFIISGNLNCCTSYNFKTKISRNIHLLKMMIIIIILII